VLFDRPHVDRYLGDILVLRQDAARVWEVIQRIRIPDGDCRDPKFFKTADDLFLFVPYWKVPGPEGSQRIPTRLFQYAPDRDTWFVATKRQPFEELNWRLVWPWRGARGPDGLYYVATHGGRRKEDNAIHLFRSANGVDWESQGCVLKEPRCSESSLVFEDGKPMVLIRRDPLPGDAGRKDSMALLAQAETVEGPWRITALNERLGGPLLFRWRNQWMVAGRRHAARDSRSWRAWKGCRTALWALRDGRLDWLCDLPSGGDCSYPGVIPLTRNRCLLSYYSTHERPEHHDELTPRRSRIYTAELQANGLLAVRSSL
jgi:hypothetical protein